jgi:CXXX repeat peptide maturase
MLKYLLVVLSESSTPFCYYDRKPHKDLKKDLVPIKNLRESVQFALKNNLKVNFLYPKHKPGRAYDALINEVDHVKIIPFELRETYPDSIIVIESDEFPATGDLKTLRQENIIFRLSKSGLPKLSSRLNLLLPKSKRINIVLTDIEKHGEEDFVEYQRQLEKVSLKILGLSAKKDPPELNVLTDRIALARMNNCDAGLTHLTVAPNGKLYVCPAFYYNNAGDTLGKIRNEVPIKNRRLLELKYSPICRICDAYHCKRCVFLNKMSTLEINTPSSQQCRLSHIEREASRLYLKKLKEIIGDSAGFNDIPEIAYSDPFEIAEKSKPSIADFKKL